MLDINETTANETVEDDEGTSWYQRIDWGVVGYVVLVVVTTVVVIGPSNLAWSSQFVVRGPDVGQPYLVPSDHLQLAYDLWLWHDAVTGGGHWPWIDPYLFGSQGGGLVVLYGWPLILFALPVSLIWGPIAAYNITVYMGFILAAVFAAAWLRSLDLSRVAAGAGGLAFAFAPFRVMQATGHATAALAWMFPLLLWCLERALRGSARTSRRWAIAAVITLVSIAFSGELHHAVYASLLTAVYVLVRLRGTSRARLKQLWPVGAVGAVLVGLSGLLLRKYLIAPSSASHGRTRDETAYFAPRLVNLVKPSMSQSQLNSYIERYVYIGAVIGVLAIAGLVIALVRRRRRALALTLSAGAVACMWLSVAPAFTGHPLLQDTYRLVPLFSFSRVPGRIMVVGTLLLAGLVALAFDGVRRWARPWMLVPLAALLVVDLPLPLFNQLSAGAHPYSALPADATILELPVRDPGDTGASIYSWYVTRHPGPRVAGYFVIVPRKQDELRKEAMALQNNLFDACAWRDLDAKANLDYVSVYRQFFPDQAHYDQYVNQLASVPGLREVGNTDGVTSFQVVDPTFGCTKAAP